MGHMAQNEAGAHKYICSILLAEPPYTNASADITPFRTCFAKVEIADALDLISMVLDAYGFISFTLSL
jgi:hypothetical protein